MVDAILEFLEWASEIVYVFVETISANRARKGKMKRRAGAEIYPLSNDVDASNLPQPHHDGSSHSDSHAAHHGGFDGGSHDGGFGGGHH